MLCKNFGVHVVTGEGSKSSKILKHMNINALHRRVTLMKTQNAV